MEISATTIISPQTPLGTSNPTHESTLCTITPGSGDAFPKEGTAGFVDGKSFLWANSPLAANEML